MSFFKFVTDRRIDILKNGQIRFTQGSEFNDPFEFRPHLTVLSRKMLPLFELIEENRINEILEVYPNFNFTLDCSVAEYKHLRDMYSMDRYNKYKEYKEKLNRTLNSYGVLSLFSNGLESRNPSMFIHDDNEPRQNILMWSHYANNHQGMVVEFDDDFFQKDMVQVNYSEKRPVITYEDIDELDVGGKIQEVLITKKQIWKNEAESRVVKKLDEANKIINDTIFLFDFDKKHIRSVTMGCNSSQEFQDNVYDILQNDSAFKNVSFFIAKIDEKDFKLKFTQRMGPWTNDIHSFLNVDDVTLITQFPPDTFDYE